MSAHRITLCRLDELEAGKARRFEVDGLAIAVVRIGTDVFAIGDRCTHQNVSLSEGEVDEDELVLECWKHGSQFSLVTGEPLQLPALKPTPVYQVEVHTGEVLLTLP
jgi:3-phenylpropionate/trans-cinnamate dioxygenase ferredoxin subunit